MDKPAIRVENLAKKYFRGAKRDPHASLRDIFRGLPERALRRWHDFRHKPDEGLGFFWALKDVTFEVKRGEVLGIIGRNGSGKSTLLKILARITKPSSGRAALYGTVGSLLEVGTGFHPELTGRENVFLSGVILGMKRAEIVKKFDEIVEFSGVEEFIDMPVKRYSSGMQVRLAFSVACHFEPEILLLDEVLAVGDAEFQEKSYQKMQAVVREGRTVVLVTHDLKAVRALCNSSLLLNKGSVVCFGPVNEALAHYQEGLDAGQSTNPASESRKIDEARLSGVRILSGGGREGAVASADPFTAEVQLFTETRLDGSLINLLIEDLSGEILSDIRTDYQDLRPTFQQGYHKLLVELPALHLSSGKYRLRFRISALDEPVPIWVDSEQKIFEVSGGPKTLGVVNPPVTWRLSGTAHPESVLRPH